MFSWGMVTAVLTIIVAALRYRGSDVVDIVVYSCWAILPPAWFLYEYTWLFPDDAKFDSHQLNDLKYKHELAGKLWAGVIVLITAILLFKHTGVKIVSG